MAGGGRRAKTGTIFPAWPQWIRVALLATTAAYTVVLVVTTHYPHPEEILDKLLAGREHPTDKSMHLVAYFLLGLLTAVTVLAHGRLTPRTAVRMAAWLAAAAVVDEITQPLSNRHTDPVDWVCDCVGILVGIVVVASVADATARTTIETGPDQ